MPEGMLVGAEDDVQHVIIWHTHVPAVLFRAWNQPMMWALSVVARMMMMVGVTAIRHSESSLSVNIFSSLVVLTNRVEGGGGGGRRASCEASSERKRSEKRRRKGRRERKEEEGYMSQS